MAHHGFCQKQIIHVYLNRTTTLVFHDNIKHVDLGSDNGIGYQTDDSIPKILKIRINDFFPSIGSTNVLVITNNEQIFSFEVLFQQNVTQTVYEIADSSALCPPLISEPITDSDSLYEPDFIKEITTSPKYLSRILFNSKGKIKLQLDNIFTTDSLLYFKCKIVNSSNLMYDIEFMHMYITSGKKLKLKTKQDTPLSTSFIIRPISISPHSTSLFVLHTPKFTMEKDNICILECLEKQGGRHLKIKIKNSTLLEAIHLKNYPK